MEKAALYMHAGSGNHGCEAIVNSTCHMLSDKVTVVSARPWEDEKYSLGQLCNITAEKKITQNIWVHLFYLIRKILTGNPMCYIRYRYRAILKDNSYRTAISVGGDNYCYPEQIEDLRLLNKALNEQGTHTVLWGASVEPALLKRSDVVEDMKRYAHIFARERITYEALIQAGVQEEKVHFYPDPAFLLETSQVSLPDGFLDGNTVGINVSPMIVGKESVPGITMENYRELIRYLIAKTDMQIALLPHVVWESNDDRTMLQKLYAEFGETKRVIMLEDCSCTKLKGYIAKMRFLVTARTHASIAAYSCMVPALVVGYSVKAEGIAKDLFGTKEHYVIPVQELSDKKELTQAFLWFSDNEEPIRKRLEECIPAYIEQAGEGGRKLKEIVEGQTE